jgi:predicted GNAT superfamily acetyltransferase
VLTISRVSDPDEIKKILPVISSAWGMPNLAAAFKDTINAMRYHGGLVAAAYDGDEMVGMQFSFPGYRKGKTYLYSHMTGIVEDKKYSGIGYQLKVFQKKWALENGYDLIAWTFDPIRSLNAHFNIRKLGAISRTLIPNFYGTMEDSLNAGIPTDRLVAEWWIKDQKEPVNSVDAVTIDASKADSDQNAGLQTASSPKTVKVAIPYDFSRIMSNDMQRAVEIKKRLSLILARLFSLKYCVVDFEKNQPSSLYVLAKEVQPRAAASLNPFL